VSYKQFERLLKEIPQRKIKCIIKGMKGWKIP